MLYAPKHFNLQLEMEWSLDVVMDVCLCICAFIHYFTSMLMCIGGCLVNGFVKYITIKVLNRISCLKMETLFS